MNIFGLGTSKRIKNIAVYSAIFGNYDVVPPIVCPDNNLRYILFTDNEKLESQGPWEVRHLRRIFKDPQMDSRRVKILAHLFLPDFDASVWIDANIHLKTLTFNDINAFLKHAEIVLSHHNLRDCIYDEADAVLEYKMDYPNRINDQMAFYLDQGFPPHFGLHSTTFLVRRHLFEQCRRFDEEWWEMVYYHSKRDQLSFDYIRWRRKVKIHSLEMNVVSNSVYDRITHNKEHFEFTDEIKNEDPRSLLDERRTSQASLPYVPDNEQWGMTFLKLLYQMNAIVGSNGEPLDDNLLYFPYIKFFPFSPPDPQRSELRADYLSIIRGKSRLLEIGVNGGHSALFTLYHTRIQITSVDVCKNSCWFGSIEFISNLYPDRYRFFPVKSKKLTRIPEELDLKSFHMFLIQGDKDLRTIFNDLSHILQFCRTGAIIVITEDDVREIAEYLTTLILQQYIQPIVIGEKKKKSFYKVIKNNNQHVNCII